MHVYERQTQRASTNIQRAKAYLKGTKDLSGDCLEGLLVFQDLLEWHKDCSGLDGSIHFGNSVVLQLLASECQPGTCIIYFCE